MAPLRNVALAGLGSWDRAYMARKNKPEIFTFCIFTGKLCHPLLWMNEGIGHYLEIASLKWDNSRNGYKE